MLQTRTHTEADDLLFFSLSLVPHALLRIRDIKFEYSYGESIVIQNSITGTVLLRPGGSGGPFGGRFKPPSRVDHERSVVTLTRLMREREREGERSKCATIGIMKQPRGYENNNPRWWPSLKIEKLDINTP